MARKPAVSVVIPNWNGRKFLPVVLKSLQKQTFKDFETIVVDNGSTDDSVEYLKKSWPDVHVEELGKNEGFSGASNRGIEVARGQFIALLNNDLELKPDWMAIMVKTLKKYPEAGSAAGKLVNYYKRNVFDGTGVYASWYAEFTKRGVFEKDTGQYDKAEWLFAVNASAIMYRKKMFDTIGLFDRSFFTYVEDTDLDFRAQLAGFKSRYEPSAVAYHMVSATGKRNPNLFARYYIHRNRCLVILKDYPLKMLFTKTPKVWLFSAKTFVGAARDKWLGTLLKAWGSAFLRTPITLVKRWKVQRKKTVPDSYMEEIISNQLLTPSKVAGRLRRK
ncbi:glycosyltransferase family 2 protein [Patescibacteria group bacterium]|nr:glycosyltransferase family 2 protein [Patescibacteria group bacterium]